MAARSDITPALCRKLLRYEADTGKLYWLDREVANKLDTAWNRRYAGTEAFTASHSEGYRVGKIAGIVFRAHRIAWAVHFGVWPDMQVDHINNDKADNRLGNLRLVDNQLNQRNVRLTRNNTSGVCGVHWQKAEGRWWARIGVDGKQLDLGRYSDLSEAIAARRDAEEVYGFSAMHGT